VVDRISNLIRATLLACAALTGTQINAAGAPIAATGTAAIPTGETVTYTFAPDGTGPHPGVLYLQGYPCRSADPDDIKNLGRNRLVAAWVKAGFLVHIAEKPGLGGGQSSKECKDLLYVEEVAAFREVLGQMFTNPEVDPENIFIFGHSMGGQTAPLIAADYEIKGIITYGIHAKPWFEFMIDITRAQAERLKFDPVRANSDTAKVIPFLYDLMIAKKDWAYLEKTHQEGLSVGVFRADGEYLNGRHYRFWADLNDAPIVDVWAKTKAPVLAMYGEYDIASISSEGAERIARIVNHHNPGKAQVMVVPRTGHGFAMMDAGFDEYLEARMGKGWSPEAEAAMFNEDVSKRVIDWMETQ
jgi:hypothetical protein